jgi:hypothetical protein
MHDPQAMLQASPEEHSVAQQEPQAHERPRRAEQRLHPGCHLGTARNETAGFGEHLTATDAAPQRREQCLVSGHPIQLPLRDDPQVAAVSGSLSPVRREPEPCPDKKGEPSVRFGTNPRRAARAATLLACAALLSAGLAIGATPAQAAMCATEGHVYLTRSRTGIRAPPTMATSAAPRRRSVINDHTNQACMTRSSSRYR